MVDRTYNEYFALRLFKLVNIRFVETAQKDTLGYPMLDCYIQLTRIAPILQCQSKEPIRLKFGAGNLGYQHRTSGQEIFDLQFQAATSGRVMVGDSATTFNSVETGVDAKITILFLNLSFEYSTPQTFFNISTTTKTTDYTDNCPLSLWLSMEIIRIC